MSVHVIYYKDGAKMMRPVLSRPAYLALRNSGNQVQMVAAIREGDTSLKHKLVQMNYSCLPNEDGSLKGSKTMSTTVGMDIDWTPSLVTPEGEEQMAVSKEEWLKKVPELVMGKKDELGLLMLECSATKGYHLVFRRRPEMSQEENLRWASDLLGVAYDKGAKDITRVFFTTTASEEDLIYLDDEIFKTDTDPSKDPGRPTPDLARPQQRSSASVTQDGLTFSQPVDTFATREGRGEAGAEGAAEKSRGQESLPSRGDLEGSEGSVECSYPLTYHGIPFSSIIKKYWDLFNDGKEPSEGDRNVLTFELAVTLRSICGYDLGKMMQVIPNYWKDTPPALPIREGAECFADSTSQGSQVITPLPHREGQGGESEWIQTLSNALKEPKRGMPFRLKQVLQALKSQQAVKACGGTLTSPPPMPKKLPPLVKLLTKNVPGFYKPAVASAVFPALGAHLHGVRFRYWDNVEHEATFMNVLIGRQSIGKGSIKKPIEYIMEDIRQRDIPNRQREAEWKQKNPSAKQKKEPRPTDICIQMLIDNLTDAVFNQRIVDAHNNGERYIYTLVDEIEALKKVTSRGTVDEVGLLIRKAFDNSLAGQERVGADSVSGIAPLRWNFNASTTPPNACKFFYKMVNDGTVSRLDIATIIKADDDDDTAPILGIYDHSFAQELKPYIDRLEAASGLIECPQARKLSMEMRSENADSATLYDSEAYRILSYRANVIAWLKGMVLYVAHGCKWSREIADFVRWSQQYNLWCKMLYFGKQLEKELREEVEMQRQSGPQNLLDKLADEFTREEYRQMRQAQGRSGSGDATLRSWVKRGHIVFDEVSGRYCKTHTVASLQRCSS